jgi:hypothetical protein
MSTRRIKQVFAAAIMITLLPKAFAAKIIPCVKGAGSDNGCGDCDRTKAIDVLPWSSTKTIPAFDMPSAISSQGGGGYDVWWVSSLPL